MSGNLFRALVAADVVFAGAAIVLDRPPRSSRGCERLDGRPASQAQSRTSSPFLSHAGSASDTNASSSAGLSAGLRVCGSSPG